MPTIEKTTVSAHPQSLRGNTSSVSCNHGLVPDEFARGAEGLQSIYDQIRVLLGEDVKDEDGCRVRPSEGVARRAFEVLGSIGYSLMRKPLPGGSVVDNGGGIRIEWWNGTGCVVLSFSQIGAEKDFLFRKDGEGDRGRLQQPLTVPEVSVALTDLFDTE